jgi:DNA-binding response OmpR family regulator
MARPAKILLVDDDADFVASTRTVLESQSYEVVVAHDGDEGLEQARADRPDLILLDVIMPAKDGFTVAEHIKNSPELSGVPVVMLTSFAQRRGETTVPVRAGYGLETEDYVDKPIKPADLLAKVEEHLERSGFTG